MKTKTTAKWDVTLKDSVLIENKVYEVIAIGNDCVTGRFWLTGLTADGWRGDFEYPAYEVIL